MKPDQRRLPIGGKQTKLQKAGPKHRATRDEQRPMKEIAECRTQRIQKLLLHYMDYAMTVHELLQFFARILLLPPPAEDVNQNDHG